MNLVCLIDSLAMGGAQKHLVQLMRGMIARGHRGRVFCLNAEAHPTFLAALRQAGVEVTVWGSERILTGRALCELRRLAQREPITALVCFLTYSTILGRMAARWLRLPVVTCLQARNCENHVWQRWLLRMTAQWNTCTVSNSKSAIAFAAVHEGIASDSALYLPNGIEPCPERLTIPDWSSVGLPQLNGRLVVGSVGRLHAQKGFDLLLPAVARLKEDFPALALLLVGQGPQEAELRRLALRLGLKESVCFAGERSETTAIVANLAAYVQPSRYEGMPNALMEAMAAGVPCVASAVDGNAELITSGRNGLLVPPEDVDSLCGALREILSDPEKARVLGAAGRRTMRDSFSLETMIESYEKLLCRISSAQ